MVVSGPNQVTRLLIDWQKGDKAALDQLMPLVYQELRKLAAGYLKKERRNHTLQPTALIHEAYVRMIEQEMPSWLNRAHFFGVAARLMRQILVDYARARNADKRGGGVAALPIDEVDPVMPAPDAERLLALDAALDRLSNIDEQATRVVEHRYFAGATEEEAGRALGISPATVRRRWAFAKAWLQRELEAGPLHVAATGQEARDQPN